MNTPTILDLQHQIQTLTTERASLNLPPLATLEASIQFHAARTVSTDAKTASDHRAKVDELLQTKQQAELAHQRAAEITNQLKTLNRDLMEAEARERMQVANDASAELSNALNEYHLACKQAIRAYRRCLNLRARNHTIPGAGTNIPRGPNFPHMNRDMNGPFSTADEMVYGLLPFEKAEREAA